MKKPALIRSPSEEGVSNFPVPEASQRGLDEFGRQERSEALQLRIFRRGGMFGEEGDEIVGELGLVGGEVRVVGGVGGEWRFGEQKKGVWVNGKLAEYSVGF